MTRAVIVAKRSRPEEDAKGADFGRRRGAWCASRPVGDRTDPKP